MVRDGANLSAADKTKRVAMNSKLEGLFSAFSSKLLGDEKLSSFVTDKAELAGIEPGFVASLRAAAEATGDRKSVVEGKSESVRESPRGLRLYNKKTCTKKMRLYQHN